MATTTESARAAAAKLLKGDWDANGAASIHLPDNLALKLLEDRGWRQDGGRWYTPNGDTYYWDRDEALQVELVAEAAGAPPTGDEAKPLKFPGYRIVTFHGGNTNSYPVPADRAPTGLADRIATLTGDAGDQDQMEAAAAHLLACVDAGMGLGPITIDGESVAAEFRDREAFVDLDGGTVWVQPLDPRDKLQRDTLHAIGVDSYGWPA